MVIAATDSWSTIFSKIILYHTPAIILSSAGLVYILAMRGRHPRPAGVALVGLGLILAGHAAVYIFLLNALISGGVSDTNARNSVEDTFCIPPLATLVGVLILIQAVFTDRGRPVPPAAD